MTPTAWLRYDNLSLGTFFILPVSPGQKKIPSEQLKLQQNDLKELHAFLKQKLGEIPKYNSAYLWEEEVIINLEIKYNIPDDKSNNTSR